MTWFQLAIRPDIVARSLYVAMFVGSILVLINNFDFLLTGQFGKISVLKVVLTYCVPYCVSTYASVSALANQSDNR